MQSLAVDKFRHFERIGYKPHSGQELFHKSRARVKVLCAGTRFGKSLSAARDVEEIVLRKGSRGWVVAPTYVLGEKEFRYIWDDLVKGLRLPISSSHYDIRGGNMDIKFSWGSEVVVKSCDNPVSLLGEELDWMIISEGSRISKDVWERYLVGRLGSRKGLCIIPTTPAGYDDFLYPLFLKGQDRSQDEIESWQFPTSMNPYFPKEEIERSKKLLSDEYFDEQYSGKFVKYSGVIYKDFDLNVHIVDSVVIGKDWERYRAIDYGVSNPFVCLWFAISPSGEVYVYDEHYEAGKPISYHAERIKDKTGNVRIETTYIDPSAGIKLDLMYEGIVVINADNDVRAGIHRVMEYLKVDIDGKSRLYICKNCHNTISEMSQYSFIGNDTDKPIKKEDHCCDAIRYFLMSRPVFRGYYKVKAVKEGLTFSDVLGNVKGLSRLKDFIGNEYTEDVYYVN
jgi:phage terminase large subunit